MKGLRIKYERKKQKNNKQRIYNKKIYMFHVNKCIVLDETSL